MANPDFTKQPQAYARIGGILYLFVIVAALFGETSSGELSSFRVMRPRPLITFSARKRSFRTGLAAEMLTCVCDSRWRSSCTRC